MEGAIAGLSWWQWAIPPAAAAAILALYFLKMRRKPVSVPSTYLWRRTVEDHRVNALWQRLRRSLLLLLQLLLIALAALALLRPTWQGSALRGGRYIFLVDNSASMSADDVRPTRLDEAKRRITSLIERMNSGDTGMVVSFADGVRVEQAFTDSRERLRRAVAEIGPTNQATSLDEALRICAGRAGPTPSAGDAPADDARRTQVFIASDGNFPPIENVSLENLEPVFIPIGLSTTKNIGIVQFVITRSAEKSDSAQALAKLKNFDAGERTVDVELRTADRLVDAQRITINSSSQKDVLFTIPQAADGVWELRLLVDDELAVDDKAWGVLAPPHKTQVLLVSPGNRYLEAALVTEEALRWCTAVTKPPAFLETPDYRSLVDSGTIDLVVFDRCRPAAAPPCSTLYLGTLPPGDAWRSAPLVDLPQVIDVARTHPLMQNVVLGEVLIAEGAPPTGPSGTQMLIDSDRGTLAVVAPRDAYEDAVLGFAMFNAEGAPLTNWPLVDGGGFEQFVLNTVQYFGRDRRGAAAESTKPGQTLRFRLEALDKATIVAPDGSRTALQRSPQGDFSFYATNQVGPYRVVDGERMRRAFAVNLFDSRESNISVADQPTLRVGQEEIVGKSDWEETRLEGWKPFLLLALVLLLAEWYIYGRRASL
ncbi:MAG: VWA domain-containing protein [Planctomycetia bacterium]|nr:VWA domain-containing protein [Planctomycetia bacterium]